MKPDEKVLDQRRAFLNAMGCAAAGFVPAADAHAQAVTPAPRSRGRDRALWITWYDLPEDGRETYLSWLHQMHIPALLKRPGFLWGAHYASVERGSMSTMRRDSSKKDPRLDPTVPTGDRYLLLFGAEHANVFGNPVPSGLHASLGPDNRKMLALRTGERMNIMVEAATVEGPEAKSYGAGMMVAPCIQLGSFNCAHQDEEEMHAWYAQSRMPRMTTLPGCVRTRKLASVAGWAKHAILYEFTSLETRNRYYMTLEEGRPEMKAWADRIVPKLIHAPGSANLATRIWPTAG
jgi:hypothetical protein